MSKQNLPSFEEDCAINSALEIISPKWNANIVLEFITAGDSLSFSEIAAIIPEISPRMLSMRISFLVDANILNKIENILKPKKVRYSLTEAGMKLAVILQNIREWGLEFTKCDNERCRKNECRHGIAISNLIKLLETR